MVSNTEVFTGDTAGGDLITLLTVLVVTFTDTGAVTGMLATRPGLFFGGRPGERFGGFGFCLGFVDGDFCGGGGGAICGGCFNSALVLMV